MLVLNTVKNTFVTSGETDIWQYIPRNHTYFHWFKVAGFSYCTCKDIYRFMNIGDELLLKREFDNAHDPNAIAVYYEGLKLGYVPRRINMQFVGKMDEGCSLTAIVVSISPPPMDNEERIGVRVFIK